MNMIIPWPPTAPAVESPCPPLAPPSGGRECTQFPRQTNRSPSLLYMFTMECKGKIQRIDYEDDVQRMGSEEKEKCICICVHTYTYMYFMYMDGCARVCVLHVCVCTCVYACMRTMYVNIYMYYVYMCICKCTCMYCMCACMTSVCKYV